jgi:hypothetical protein
MAQEMIHSYIGVHSLGVKNYMKKLNLPPFDYKIKTENSGNRIFDIIRKKYLLLTPEEWVRQHFVHYLIEHCHYPRSLISIETGLKYNQLRKRSDIIVYDKSGIPFLLVECKSADIQISKNAVFQATTYNQTVRAPYLVVTNGMGFICAKTGGEIDQLKWLDSLPPFPIT